MNYMRLSSIKMRELEFDCIRKKSSVDIFLNQMKNNIILLRYLYRRLKIF